MGQSAAEVFLKESWSYSRSIGNRSGSALQGPRLKTIDQAAELYAQTKEHMFERAAAEEQAKLLKYILNFRSNFLFSSPDDKHEIITFYGYNDLHDECFISLF